MFLDLLSKNNDFYPKTCFSLDLLMWGLILESILGPAGHPPAHLESAGIFLVPVWDPSGRLLLA
jgi:hypothetical protein